MSNYTVIPIPASNVDIVYSSGPFDVAIAGLREGGADIWNAEKLAELRVQLGASHPVSRRWSWVAENVNYMTGTDADILVASGQCKPLLKDPTDATNAYRKGREFNLANTIASELRERATPDPEKARQTGVFLLTRKEVKRTIPTQAFHEEGITRFLFGDQAESYGAFLQANRITEVPLYLVKIAYAQQQGEPFARALSIDRLLGLKSSLNGDGQGLHDVDGRVGGVHYHVKKR